MTCLGLEIEFKSQKAGWWLMDMHRVEVPPIPSVNLSECESTTVTWFLLENTANTSGREYMERQKWHVTSLPHNRSGSDWWKD